MSTIKYKMGKDSGEEERRWTCIEHTGMGFRAI